MLPSTLKTVAIYNCDMLRPLFDNKLDASFMSLNNDQTRVSLLVCCTIQTSNDIHIREIHEKSHNVFEHGRVTCMEW